MPNTQTLQIEPPVFVIIPLENGWQVYSPDNPRTVYMVTGIPDSPACTCPEFQANRVSCYHIAAVLEKTHARSSHNAAPGKNGKAEPETAMQTSPATQMHIKRSVSPDGRIDSLSVEFTTPVSFQDIHSVQQQADQALALQACIADTFRERTPAQTPPRSNNCNGAEATGSTEGEVVHLTNIAGRQTVHGWRLYINVRCRGENVFLFGDKKKLGDYLSSAGYPQLANNIQEGNQLNVPCKAVVVTNGDSKYPKIDRLMPINGAAHNGG